MRTMLAITLVLTLPASALADGPLERAVARAAAAAAQQSPRAPRGGGQGMTWAGVAMLGAGGTLATLGATALKNETCGAVVIGFDVISGCVEETNKALLWTGVGIAAGGATLLAVGASRNVEIGPTRLAYKVRF
jgi:hypothetical protein